MTGDCDATPIQESIQQIQIGPGPVGSDLERIQVRSLGYAGAAVMNLKLVERAVWLPRF